MERLGREPEFKKELKKKNQAKPNQHTTTHSKTRRNNNTWGPGCGSWVARETVRARNGDEWRLVSSTLGVWELRIQGAAEQRALTTYQNQDLSPLAASVRIHGHVSQASE
jgi:hypothetical protein